VAYEGSLQIAPAFGQSELDSLIEFLNDTHTFPEAPSIQPPLDTEGPDTLKWDGFTAASPDVMAKWLEIVFEKFLHPIRWCNGVLLYEGKYGKATIDVTNNVVKVTQKSSVPADVVVDSSGEVVLKADGTPKKKPGPKPKTFKEIVEEKKKAPANAAVEQAKEAIAAAQNEIKDLQFKVSQLEHAKAMLESQLKTTKIHKNHAEKEMQKQSATIKALEENYAKLEKELSSAKEKAFIPPPGKKFVMVKVSDETDMNKFGENIKYTIMGLEEVKVFDA
jgi:molybdopterin converting factor small subunit